MSELLRSLENYKQMHMVRAVGMDKEAEFKAARTLTEARKIVFGEKHKKYTKTKEKGTNK